ncbi:YsnF/AvaK domain-containing protein [Oligoflexus tunisiensis]|uniref:YsnF/AvaK domain-containing protein n=1 Tax=Oligoflexus tunisiensis TaxID=708132 RepID=UPI00114C8F5B|nr:YsnF/AvaK domain-containing protein [Oligoflexus tunisiensis]
MQAGSRTIIGIFSELTDAKHATDELRSLGISTVRLVENDQDVTFTGTAERQGASSGDVAHGLNAEHKKTGIGAFFSRLFGFDDDRPTWNLSRDSEAYFQNAYDRKHHLVIVEDCSDLTVCREVITRFGGQIEEQGGQYYETERYRDQGLAGTGSDLNRDQSLSSSRLDRDQSLSGTGSRLDTDDTLTGTGSRVGMDQTLSSDTRIDRDQSLNTGSRLDQSTTGSNLDFDRDTSLAGNRSGLMEDQTLTDRTNDFNRDQSLSGARLDTSMDSDLASERVMELREEQLDVHTERMQTGEVQLRKEIITETKSVDVPVTREEIVVERRPLEGVAQEGSLDTAGLDTEKEIRIPVSEEFVHIDKKVAPREEVRVSKEKITDTKSVSEEVRREEAHVDSDGRVSVKDRSDTTRPPLSSSPNKDNIQPGV